MLQPLRWAQTPALLLLLSWMLTAGCADGSSESRSAANAAGATHRLDSAGGTNPGAALGEGFLVWESNRSGWWRIWTRELTDPGARQLTPDETSRPHCCPHISPDGAWIAYMSVAGVAGYAADGGSRGELRLIRPNGTGNRVIAPRARSLFENRAVVWRSPSELIFMRGDGRTLLLDVIENNTQELLGGSEAKARAWLLNSRLSHAVTGKVDFSPYDTSRRAVAQRNFLGGCQPYFSHDGRWGFWTAGTGGPVRRVDLATGGVSTILEKSDPRIPDGLGYVYFPMFSRDARLFTFAASDGAHDHFKSDYEVFVAETDPETLELLGDAVRMTSNPATDRFPDVYLAPLELGRRRGEAPFEAHFQPAVRPSELDSSWTFEFGDGSTGTGSEVTHTYLEPGEYQVHARPIDGSGTAFLRGRVSVQPTAPPRAVAVSLADQGRTLVVRFDEEILIEQPNIQFESGRGVAGWSLGADRRSLIVQPATRVESFDRISLDGISDRAQRANWIEPTWLEVEPPLWPSDRRGLVFLWETADAANLILDEALATDRASTLQPTGGARLNHDYAMALGTGSFGVPQSDADYVFERCTVTNQCSLEAVVRPAEAAAVADGDLRRIVSFSSGTPRGRNFLLAQRNDRLLFSPRVAGRGPNANPEIDLGRIPTGQATHVVVSFEPGRLAAFVNGKQVATEPIGGGFFHWRKRPLLMGNGPGDGPGSEQTWAGALEGVAIYNRFIEGAEARENYLRYREDLEARPVVPRLVVEATLRAKSPAPSLGEISPYREALVVFEYQLDAVVGGAEDMVPDEQLRVAHWAILDGADLGIDRAEPGGRRRLVLEPYADNPQLESVFLSDSLPTPAGPLFYAVSP